MDHSLTLCVVKRMPLDVLKRSESRLGDRALARWRGVWWWEPGVLLGNRGLAPCG